MLKELSTVAEVIEELGGTAGILASDPAITRPQAISNWRVNNRLPANRFLTHSEQLRRRGFTAPASLWGMAEPTHEAAE